jgi:ethanolamine utilization protein EutA
LPPLTGQHAIDAISFSGGVAEFVYGYDQDGYGDLGPLLADEIRVRINGIGVELVAPIESIRATVIGASQYTIQVSGGTIFVSPDDILPIRNVPVIAPLLPLSDETLDTTMIAQETAAALRRLDLSDGHSAVAVCFAWQGSATFQRVDALLRGIIDGLQPVLAAGYPLLLVSDGDVGGVLGIHCREEMVLQIPVISIDGIDLKEFDYIDIGALIPSSGAVPVVIKSLIFPQSAALGR